jgi:hypothetical protein
MYTFCDSDPKKGCILVDAVKFWPNYWAPHTMFENFDAALPQDMKWSAGSERKTRTAEVLAWLKTPNLFGDEKIRDKHFRSNEDMFVAARWAEVINAVGKRYFDGPIASFSKFPRQSIAQTNAPPPEPEPEEESPLKKRSRYDQLGAAAGSFTMGLMVEQEESGAVPNKKKRKARAVKEFDVTWETNLESSNMSANHVSQAFALMNTKRITPAEGITVTAKNCIEPALERLARPLDKLHVSFLQDLYKKEQGQGDLWVVWKQLRLSCSFVITSMCPCVNCLC